MNQNNNTRHNFQRILQTTTALLSITAKPPARSTAGASPKPDAVRTPRHFRNMDWPAHSKGRETPPMRAR